MRYIYTFTIPAIDSETADEHMKQYVTNPYILERFRQADPSDQSTHTKPLITDSTLAELLEHDNETVRRSAISIFKQLQKAQTNPDE